jgi:murE/murF fusion protein
MELSTLANALTGAKLLGQGNPTVEQITSDSREIGDGCLFVAVKGMRSDGHDFIDAAVKAGAVAVVVEEQVETSVPQVITDNTAAALGILTATLAGNPGATMRLVGITGTNGKTTTSYLVESILRAAGETTGVIGTVSYRIGDEVKDAPYTTPTPDVLHGVFGDMRAARCSAAVLEVSSAALSMSRLAGVDFEVGVFTNFTQDHLEVHGTMEEYREAKARLFRRHLAEGGTAVVNVDDAEGDFMAEAAAGHRILRVSVDPERSDADVYARDITSSIEGIRATIHTPRGPIAVHSRALIGHYNVANLATTVAVGEALGLSHEAIARGIEDMAGVPGRVERVANGHGLDILVDYAHTPDALVNVLAALKPLVQKRLICVFGCGGDRDPSKRPKMGAAVTEAADLAVVTSDNPRTEDPHSIIEMILPGVPKPFYVDSNRRRAIAVAVAEATPGDIVLIAGKGHEDYQIIGTEKIHFDDREEAAAAAKARPTYSVQELVGACSGSLLSGDGSPTIERVVIDGRQCAPGDLYVAIVGERFDGHDFCKQALDAGAVALLVSKDVAVGDVPVIKVDDTRVAMGAIAGLHRQRWGAESPRKRLIAITGSSGKTTVKGLVAHILEGFGGVHAAKGSLNNETGVPLTLLGMRSHHDFAVAEMGMRAVGQISYLTNFAKPDVGVVTNAQVAHVGVVGSVDDIARGKSEIFLDLPDHGFAIYPAGDSRLRERAQAAPRGISFGAEESADVRLLSWNLDLGDDGDPTGMKLTLASDDKEVSTTVTGLVGEHNAMNAACAVATVVAAGIDFEWAAKALARPGLDRYLKQAPMRSEIRRLGRRLLFVDCYNANPSSMSAAIQTVSKLAGSEGFVAVVGDMLELGETAAEEHIRVGEAIANAGGYTVALGEHSLDVLRGAKTKGIAAVSPERAAMAVVERPEQWVMFKASRGMRLERVVELLEARAEN